MNVELNALKVELDRLRNEYEDKAKACFQEELNKLFDEYPKLEEFTLSVNNHEFNDGDATYFSIYTDEPRLNGYELDEFEDNEKCLTAEEADKISDKISAIFNLVDDDILEDLYGDAYESLTIERE